MFNIQKSKALAACAGLAFALLSMLVTAAQGDAQQKAHKSITFDMPACPIQAKTMPPTKTPFQLPDRNILGQPVSVAGTIQVTDQTSSTVMLLQTDLAVDQTGVSFARTVKTLQHATGSLSFDKGCTKTDPYGSNNCQGLWGEQITKSSQGALQEDITAGKLIVDLKINNTIPFQFTCAVCGASCTVQIPQEIDHGRWNLIWDGLLSSFRHHHRHDADGN